MSEKEEVLKQARQKTKRKEVKEKSVYIPTGSTQLDSMLCGGYELGDMYNIIGPSGCGKTFYAVEAIYQAKKKFGDKVKVRYGDFESGFKFDTETLYGYSLKDNMVKDVDTIQEFMGDLGSFVKNLKKDEVGLYIVDSFDGLCSDDDIEEYEKRVDAHEKGKTYSKGSYDASKQKFASKLFRTMKRKIKDKNVVLFVISQLRDKFNVTFGSKWSVSGGNGLLFYSDGRLFIRDTSKFLVNGLRIGYCAEVTGVKTRNPYPNRQCYINILHDPEYGGFDNVGSNIDYLYELKDETGKLIPAKCKSIQWGTQESKDINKETIIEFLQKNDITVEQYKDMSKSKTFRYTQVVDWIMEQSELKSKFVDEFGTISREGLISYIEDNNIENELSAKAKKKWYDIEEAIRPKRKKKSL